MRTITVTAFFGCLVCQGLHAAQPVSRLHRIDENGHCGYADGLGKVVAPPRYRGCGAFSGGLAALRDGKLWGYLAETGALAIKPQFAGADAFSEGQAFVELDSRVKAIIDRSGKILARGEFYDHGSFHNGLALVFVPSAYECVRDDSGPNDEIHSDADRKRCPPGHLGASEFEGQWVSVDASGNVVGPTGQSHPKIPGPRTAPAPNSLLETFDRLQEIRFPYRPDAIGFGPPPEVDTLFRVYKKQLRVLATETLQHFPALPVSARVVQLAHFDQLRKMGIGLTTQPVEPRPYGLLCPKVERFRQQPDLLAVTFQLNLPGQSEDSLSLFHLSKSGWELVHEADREHPLESGRAVRKFETLMFTPKDAGGSFLMLQVSHDGFGPTWGNTLTVELYRFDAAYRATRLFRDEHGAKQWRYVLDPDGFRLETQSYPVFGTDGCCWTYPFRYKLAGGKVQRVAPVAFNPRQFVGVWSEMPWEEAARWSDPANPALRQWHEGKHELDGDGDAEACDAGMGAWQVNFEKLHFTVEQKDPTTFVMKSVSETPQRGCRKAKDPKWKSTIFETPLKWSPFG